MTPALVALAIAAAPPPVSVAVLYFDNDSGDPAYDVLRKGLCDMVTTDLVGVSGLTVVERRRLEDVLKELSFQRSRWVDRTTAQRVGKLLGATHAVTGAITAVAPRVRLDVRLVAVRTGAVVASAAVVGDPADLFELEQAMVGKLLAGLSRSAPGPTGGHVSLQALTRYATALDHVDRDQLSQARSTLAEVVSQAPDFPLARARFAEVLRRLKDAQARRGEVLSDDEVRLEAALEALARVPPPTLGDDEASSRFLGAMIARCNLTLVRIRRLVRPISTGARWVPPALREELARLEEQYVSRVEALVPLLSRAAGLEPSLPPDVEDAGKALAGFELSSWSFASPTSARLDLANFLGSGWAPHYVDIEPFAVRPSAVQRSEAMKQKALTLFEEAQRSLGGEPEEARERLAVRLFNEKAEMLALLGQPEAAAAQLQRFLDVYPRAADFPVLARKLEELVLLSDDAARAEGLLARCDEGFLAQAAQHATRVWRAQGAAGVVRLAVAMKACAARAAAFRQPAVEVPYAEATRAADCVAFARLPAIVGKPPADPQGCLDGT